MQSRIDIKKEGLNDNMIIINYYNEDKLCSKIYANLETREVSVRNFTDNNIEKAFGLNEYPIWSDFEAFLERRCFPKDRQNIKLELKKLGLNEYNPLEICKATGGRNYKDNQWMNFDEEESGLDDSYERD